MNTPIASLDIRRGAPVDPLLARPPVKPMAWFVNQPPKPQTKPAAWLLDVVPKRRLSLHLLQANIKSSKPPEKKRSRLWPILAWFYLVMPGFAVSAGASLKILRWLVP